MWWNRYWFEGGGRVAAGVVRIALAVAVMLLLSRLRDLPPISPASVYQPVGLLLLFPTPPAAWVIDAATVLAWGGAVAMLVGLYARAATVVTAVGALLLASHAMSFQRSWSHDFPIVLIALIAFLGARGGDALSLDALRRRPPEDACYQWSLRLTQLAVALMFGSACLLKLRSGGLAWAWSDNLRHQLLARYDLIGSVNRPAIVDWLLEDDRRYHVAAALNLVAQAVPLAAIVFARRPVIRAIAAVVFVGEVAALYIVMQLGNPSWFPLAAVFVDWDALWPRPQVTVPRVGMAPRIFVVAFVVYDVAISFVPGLDLRMRTFPFSRFPLFASVRAREPYDVHQSYDFAGERIELIAARSSPAIQSAIDRDYAFRWLYREREPALLRARMVALVAELRLRYPDLGIRGVRLYLATYRVPAYPAPARLREIDVGILGELVDDRWTTYLTRAATPSGRVDEILDGDGVTRSFVIARRATE